MYACGCGGTNLPSCHIACAFPTEKGQHGLANPTLTNRWIYTACRLRLANVSRGAGIQLSSYNIGPSIYMCMDYLILFIALLSEKS